MRRQTYQAAARADVSSALKVSHRKFGPRARRNYKALIDRALAMLCENPQRSGVERREDLAGAPYLFHIRHARTKGAAPKQARHIIVFTYDETTLSIIRVLHDAMDVDVQISETPEE